MDFIELVKMRRSVRKYTDEPIDISKIITCIEAARLAPSACNSQPWSMVVVVDHDKKKKLAHLCQNPPLKINNFTSKAQAIVALVVEKSNFASGIGGRLNDKEYNMIDIGIACEHFCLQAADIGLGTCILGHFKEEKAKELLDVPKNKRILLLIAMGHPADTIREKVRRPIEEIFSIDEYN